MNRQEKIDVVKDLQTEFGRAKAAYLTHVEKMTVAETLVLRNRIRAAGGKYRVVKNTLAQLGSRGTCLEMLTKDLVGSIGWAYTEQDPVSLAKVLKDYQKEKEAFTFTRGVFEGSLLDAQGIKAVAAMPSKEVLMTQILGLLQGSARNLVTVIQAVPRQLVNVLEAIRKKKEEESKNG